MEGFNRERSVETRGIIPRSIELVFNHISKYASSRKRFLVRASYLQIYNEQVVKTNYNNMNLYHMIISFKKKKFKSRYQTY